MGKRHQVKLALCCLLAEGHLLIEDVPGVGKTTMALFFSKMFGVDFKRIQLTSDLLPADITGNLVFNNSSKEFELHKGAIFSNIVLADELNRATPKTQSAFLEAMEEKTVSIDRKSYTLDSPFWVIATQNPRGQIGTFLLPESQLERFLMHIDLGFPDAESERKILKGDDPRSLLKSQEALFEPTEIKDIFEQVKNITVSDPVIDYIQRILQYTRDNHRELNFNSLSPRTGRDIVRASQSWAFFRWSWTILFLMM